MSAIAERPSSLQPRELPHLENGDVLDQPTFHARYEAMPHGFRAELIGGIVYVASPMLLPHSKLEPRVSDWLGEFEDSSPALERLSTPSVILGPQSEPQPDFLLRILPEYGGRTRDDNNYVNGSPELAVEIASSTESYDLNQKKRDYERAGILEYLVFLERRQEARWFRLENGEYQQLQPGEDGVLRSHVFPGLWLLPETIFKKNKKEMRRILKQGLASAEHKAWKRKLIKGGRTPG